MSTKTEGVGISPEPAFLEFPDKASYWSCWGTFRAARKWWFTKDKPVGESAYWSAAYYSKEDAEADAVNPTYGGWVWDRQPATPVLIAEMMARVRMRGGAGVKIISFRDGQWVTVRRYPANEPLPEDLR